MSNGSDSRTYKEVSNQSKHDILEFKSKETGLLQVSHTYNNSTFFQYIRPCRDKVKRVILTSKSIFKNKDRKQ